MRTIWLWSLLAIAAGASGCGVAKELCRYTREQLEYHEIVDECLINMRNRKLAADAWCEYQLADPRGFSDDYAAGFVDGYADYLDEGPGAPPIVPPRCYWKAWYQNPAGHQRGQDWLDGFRAGAIAAEQSGNRNWKTVPTVTGRA